VIEILDNDSIYVSAPLDEVDVGRVRVGPPVRITLDAYPGRSFPGHVARVAPYVLDLEEQNRTVEIEVEFDDAGFASTLLPGTSADVEVILDEVHDVLRIPSYALVEGKRVLVVRDGVLVAVEVETGLSNWQFTEVRGGLSADELVVVSLDRVEVQEGAITEVTAETEK
jgi:HlyD family secretion protein